MQELQDQAQALALAIVDTLTEPQGKFEACIRSSGALDRVLRRLRRCADVCFPPIPAISLTCHCPDNSIC